MRKIFLWTLVLFWASNFGQRPETLRMMPDFIPPSPSVNSLMKFEEVPVSNYTGIPEISIPLKSFDIGIKDVSMNIFLRYHTNNAKLEEKASDTGTGWSLAAGGTISRTVLSSPDDRVVTPTIGGRPKIGIYFDENTNVSINKNYFHHIIEGTANPSFDVSKMMFEAHYYNMYDTEYDLYQYNFLNYTGRFILKKIHGELIPIKWDMDNLKIKVTHTASFEPISFIITDEFGNNFFFDVLEKSSTNTFSDSQDVIFQSHTTSSVFGAAPYNSSFHLSQIKDGNMYSKVKLKYLPPRTTLSSESIKFANYYETSQYPSIFLSYNRSYLPRTQETISSNISTGVRYLQEIEIVDQGAINFEYEYGRQDSNIGPWAAEIIPKLKSVFVKSVDSQHEEQFDFDYSYKIILNTKKLYLDKISKKVKENGSYVSDYIYDLQYHDAPQRDLTIDAWKFVKCANTADGQFSYSDECVSAGLIKSITYPTKGKSKFFFEANTYSYIPQEDNTSGGSLLVSNFDRNELNWNIYNSTIGINVFSNNKKFAFSAAGTEPISVTMYADFSGIMQYTWQLNVFVDNTIVKSFSNGIGQLPPESFTFSAPPGNYFVQLKKIGPGSVSAFNTSYNFFYKQKNNQNLEYLHGGGVRIKAIHYLDYSALHPVKTTNYHYTDPTNQKRSSGALVVPEPILSYTRQLFTKLELDTHVCQMGAICLIDFNQTITYSSNKNFLPTQKSKGGDIGYRFVTISEINNGRILYEYSSPVDAPNSEIMYTYPPFHPIPDDDFTRGNLIRKKIFNSSSDLVAEYNNNQLFKSVDFKVGAKTYPSQWEFLYADKYSGYEGFCLDTSGSVSKVRRYLTGCHANQIIDLRVIAKRAGIALNTREVSKMYFQNNHTVTTAKYYQYNLFNRPIMIVTKDDNSIYNEAYSYAPEKGNLYLISKNMIGIPLETTVIKKKDSLDTGKIRSQTLTNYPISQSEADTKTNGLPVPYNVLSKSLENTTMEKDIAFTQYDSQGNLQEYRIKDIAPVAIIYGYNNTRPIAQIEGASYAQVQGHISEMVTASNADNTLGTKTTEDSLLALLDAFRKKPALSGFLITTYTYDPLIGVRSITPPSGIREVYIYDAANRLKEIREGTQNGNILKEYKYNYKQ